MRMGRHGRCTVLGHLRNRSHHLGELFYVTLERAFLSAGTVLAMLVLLFVIYLGLVLLKL